MTLLLLYLILILQTLADEESDRRVNCITNEDGEEVCVELSDDVDYTEHVLNLPKNYDCDNIRETRDCDWWAKEEICDKDPGFMILNCPKSCGFCHLRDPKVRCQRHPNAKQAVYPGDIDKMFNRLITEFGDKYSIQVLSSPEQNGPWLIVLNNVFTDEECSTLIEIGGRNFHRSKDAGSMNDESDAQFEEIVSDVRTSFTDWCVDNCWDVPIINGMAQKAENITMIPKENSEFFQVLRYEKGQYYQQHHDYIYGHLDLPIGPRIYTFFIYLNDPEQGGGTKFNNLNITVQPKKGSVAIWPSVLNEDPFKKEERTYHEALPIEQGIKYAANLWLHMYNFHGPFSLTCTG